ncbi:hypothetical protein DPMN_029969 [Dreissena polymorpha]|uniref:Uncharacterized protein n=1 Tax=Dreissena polymorpha TaxID=45954 RepID=A0A9D4M1S6_DREPO|nr:hypothetical protein DPMN_029969 [Dreissena polymorpha]
MKNEPQKAPWRKCFQQTRTIFELYQDIIGTNLLTKFHEEPTIYVASTVLTRQIFMTHNGRQTIDKRENYPTPGGHVFPPIWTIFELNLFTFFHYIHLEKTAPPPDINETNVLTKFHDDWAKRVTSRVFTRNTAPPLGGHVFQTNNLTKIHEDWAPNVTSTVFTSFELSRAINWTNVLTKFHKDQKINVACRVFTRQMLTTDDARRTKGDHKSSP